MAAKCEFAYLASLHRCVCVFRASILSHIFFLGKRAPEALIPTVRQFPGRCLDNLSIRPIPVDRQARFALPAAASAAAGAA